MFNFFARMRKKEARIVVEVGQIWQRYDSVIQHNIKLLKYLGDDIWSIEFILYNDHLRFHDTTEMMAEMNGEITGAYLYRHYICVSSGE